MNNHKKLSVIIPITERYDPIQELYYEYKEGIVNTGLEYEIIYVLDGNLPHALGEIQALQDQDEPVTIISLAKSFGEATALNAAFNNASGEVFLTLPSYRQMTPNEIPKLLDAMGDNDMVLARRWPRDDSITNRLQNHIFNALLRLSTNLKIHDAGCGVRVFSRRVIEEVQLYGDLHRFFPVMAHRQGFRVQEINVKQAQQDKKRKIYAPGLYIRRLLDLLTIFFLIKFTKKPLRFFGLVGTSLFSIGLLSSLYLVGERLFLDVSLADRPALILSTLLIVLGIQIIAIGLIGEIIIFTHAKDLKEYKIDRIIGKENLKD